MYLDLTEDYRTINNVLETSLCFIFISEIDFKAWCSHTGVAEDIFWDVILCPGLVAPSVLNDCGAFIFWIKYWTEVNLYISFLQAQFI